MNDPRKTLLQQIAALRSTIDPQLLTRARLATEGKEPYDRVTARAAVQGFLALKFKQDGGAFQRRLMAALKQQGAPPSTDSAPTPDRSSPQTPQRPQPPKRGTIRIG